MKLVSSAALAGMSFDSAVKDVKAEDILEEDIAKVEKEAHHFYQLSYQSNYIYKNT